jgi:hypothetical protein
MAGPKLGINVAMTMLEMTSTMSISSKVKPAARPMGCFFWTEAKAFRAFPWP